MNWEVWPTNKPKNIDELLKNNRFQFSRNYPAMTLELEQLQEDETFSLEIRKVVNDEQASTLADLFIGIYELPEIVREGFIKTIISAGFDQDSQLISYIGYDRGKPVSISSVYYKAGVAGVYNVGTMKDYCRKGYGKEMTIYLETKNKGYHYAILQSSVQGEKVYQQMGFKEQCRINVFKYESKQ